MFEEVMNIKEANYAIVLSESFKLKRVLKKIFFYSENTNVNLAPLMKWVIDNYYYLIYEGVRIDIYEVKSGYIVGRTL